MMLLRALHLPGGAIALLTALDPGPALEAGPLSALLPAGLTTAALVPVAVPYHRPTGRLYPFRLPETVKEPAPRLGLSEAQLGALLDRFNQSTNLGVVDLGRMLAAAQAEAARHRFDGTTCADIMTTGLITVRPDMPLPAAARLFCRHAIKSLLDVGVDMTLRGILLPADLLHAVVAQGRPLALKLRSPRLSVSEVMRPPRRRCRMTCRSARCCTG